MLFHRFAVFDVETPNSANSRMSAIGLAIIENGQIVKNISTLLDPETHFDPFNIQLTGITPEQVAGKPTFPVLWQLLEPMLSNAVLVAHNAPFDMGVLSHCLRDYGISWQPCASYLCTCQIGRKCMAHLPNRKLSTLCDHLNIPLQHHDAGSDSLACAQLLLHYQRMGIDFTPYLRTYDLIHRRTIPAKAVKPEYL